MRSRYLAAAGAVWALAYLCGYVWLVRSQGDPTVAWWYVVLVAGAAGAVAVGGAAVGPWPRPVLVAGLAGVCVASLLGIMTIGLFLAPAVLLTAAAIHAPATVRRASRGGRTPTRASH